MGAGWRSSALHLLTAACFRTEGRHECRLDVQSPATSASFVIVRDILLTLVCPCSEVAKFCQKYLAGEITRLEKYHQGNLPDSLVEVSLVTHYVATPCKGHAWCGMAHLVLEGAGYLHVGGHACRYSIRWIAC